MLSRTTDRTPARLLLVAGTVFAGLLLATGGPARAQAVKTDTSLSFIPAEAAFYGANLRGKEQMDILLKSNAYKSLRNLPLVKMAVEKLKEKLKEKDSPLKMYEKFVENKDNKALIDLATEAGSQEVFIYGGKTWGDLLKVAGEVSNAQSFAPLKALLDNNDPNKAQLRAILLTLQSKRQMLKVPDLVLGFKIKNTKNGENQVKRLEKILGGLEEVVPLLKGKVNSKKIAGGNFLTLEADGSMIPWDDVNLKDYEDKKDEFDDLLKHLKKMTLTVSLGVRGDYLLFGISPSTKEIEKFDGKQVSLAESEEFKPLAKYAGKPLVGISYFSKAFLQALSGGGGDYAEMAKSLKEMVGKADISEEQKKSINKDLDELAADTRKHTPSYGAMMAFSFMTDTGYEGYSYNFAKHTELEGTKVTLQSHFGGDPIFAAAFGAKNDGSFYKELVNWLKKIHGHAEAIFLDKAPEEAKGPYERVTKALFPILKKIDENTSKKFIPSIKHSGLGLVLDAKWSSKQWLKELPATPKEMPLAELGLLLGISDAKLFEEAMKSYRTLTNELIEAVRTSVPNGENIPEFKIPAPKREVVKSGVLVYYPLPMELGVDKQVQPVAGIGQKVSVLALSKTHAERLMVNKPLKLKSGPLARKGDLIGLSVLDWPAFVNFATPWVEMGVRTGLAQAKEAKGMNPDSVVKQVKVVLAAMKTFKSASTVTYLEEGKLVSHTEIIIKDFAREVPASDEPAPEAPKEEK